MVPKPNFNQSTIQNSNKSFDLMLLTVNKQELSLNKQNSSYYKYFDSIISILIERSFIFEKLLNFYLLHRI
jgi:hypothetical protein